MTDSPVARAHALKPSVWIGRRGIDDALLLEIRQQLRKNKLVKIKMLRGAIEAQDLDRKKIPALIAKKTDADIVQQVGFVFTLHKER